jgi:hypothetical protein
MPLRRGRGVEGSRGGMKSNAHIPDTYTYTYTRTRSARIYAHTQIHIRAHTHTHMFQFTVAAYLVNGDYLTVDSLRAVLTVLDI